jgi:hypothetical protein
MENSGCIHVFRNGIHEKSLEFMRRKTSETHSWHGEHRAEHGNRKTGSRTDGNNRSTLCSTDVRPHLYKRRSGVNVIVRNHQCEDETEKKIRLLFNNLRKEFNNRFSHLLLTYAISTMIKEPTIALGMLFCGLWASSPVVAMMSNPMNA